MPNRMKNIVRIGKETTRGTPVTGTLTAPFLSDGFRANFSRHLAKIRSSSTFPYMTRNVPLGLSAALSLNPEVNVATIRDLMDMAYYRNASGDLPALTIEETSCGVGQQKLAGCVCQSLEMNFQRGSTPDESSLLSLQLAFAAMSQASASGITAGTQGSGRHFQLRHSSFTINSVAALAVLGFRARRVNTLALGPHDSADALLYIEDGEAEDELELTARFSTEAWRDLVKNATEHAGSIVLATGTANETVTLAVGAGMLESHELGEQDGTVTERIMLSAAHTGSVSPIVVTYGSAIGASVLNLQA